MYEIFIYCIIYKYFVYKPVVLAKYHIIDVSVDAISIKRIIPTIKYIFTL